MKAVLAVPAYEVSIFRFLCKETPSSDDDVVKESWTLPSTGYAAASSATGGAPAVT